MSVRTSFIGIVAVGALITALVAGLVQAHESSPPSLGDTIEVSPSSAVLDGRTGTESPAPGSSSSPKPSAPTTAGGDAVPPPPVPPGDDDGSNEDDGPRSDDDRDDDDRDDG
ncbi:hypothetical protein [Actinomadura livida]|uniref:Uncharacterized protein n=1 Tax=Actinomadura livida TaxID=79909 RepID=A0A7W7I9N4_9ACTN|nr:MULTISPECIES: hypothetical protein [Actinomadura]MBB4772975.1 hypothetical protein [Actinomadura catellatispora]GGU39920.1 hypothetical protein GCM10010208_75110 [Actinomadura livida]